MGLRHIIHVGRRRHHRVHQAGIAVHADVRFQPEEPLVVLLGLVHLRIARAAAVLGRTGRVDDRGVHHSALAQQQTALGQIGVDRRQHLRRQAMALQPMPEVEAEMAQHFSGAPVDFKPKFGDTISPDKVPHNKVFDVFC